MSEKGKKKVLFVGLHRPWRSPSQRYRIEQFLPHLEKKHFEFDYSYLLNETDDRVFYSSRNYFGKFKMLIKSTLKRLFEVYFEVKNYEYVFVQREAFMLGTAFFEKLYAKKAKLIFDFDDSIWMHNISEANKKLAFLKNPAKTSEIIKNSHQVVVGNSFLANYASRFNSIVTIIPTSIDTDEYNRTNEYTEKPDKKVCIGWSGSQTTIEHFKLIESVLKKLQNKYGKTVCFKVIGDASYENKELNIKGLAWQRATEISELEEIDIGIMPLPDDEWTKGKCGLKGLVYMSMQIPAVIQNVGANKEIIQNGANGFLANSDEEWFEKLSTLIENFELRKKIGENGRISVLKYYSVDSQKDAFLKIFEQ
jgi:glycosyltransferase involved in cell wall biosynthesis